MLHDPSMEGLAEPLAEAARSVARTLEVAGFRGWIVGGAVRDLALGRTPKDVDMVSAAHPDRVIELFEHTHAIGKAFGIVLVQVSGVDLEVATFRTESGYSDARHPDRIQFAQSPQEDALRRDFTCNAMYLDPLNGEVCDPCGGLQDLSDGRLATVGEPRDRFTEDGLRLLRLARFGAQLGLEPAPGLLEAAALCADSLSAVSPERVRAELEGCLYRGAPERALEILAEAGLLGACLPWLAKDEALVSHAREVLARLGPAAAGPAGWVACLVADGEDPGIVDARAEALRFSTSERKSVIRSAALASRWVQLGAAATSLSARILATRTDPWRPAWDLARARCECQGKAEDLEVINALGSWRAGLTPEQLHPPQLVGAKELEAAGIPRGPRWSELIALGEAEQMDGKLTTSEDVPAWLRVRAANPDGSAGRQDAP
ncbi:MAG: CCA tRNA nucleotidyltransferase [bacterium]